MFKHDFFGFGFPILFSLDFDKALVLVKPFYIIYYFYDIINVLRRYQHMIDTDGTWDVDKAIVRALIGEKGFIFIPLYQIWLKLFYLILAFGLETKKMAAIVSFILGFFYFTTLRVKDIFNVSDETLEIIKSISFILLSIFYFVA